MADVPTERLRCHASLRCGDALRGRSWSAPRRLTYTPSSIALMCVMYCCRRSFTGGAAISPLSAPARERQRSLRRGLLGAAAGWLLLMPALNIVGAPGAIVCSAALGVLASAGFVERDARGRLAAQAAALAVVAVAAGAAGARSARQGPREDPVCSASGIVSHRCMRSRQTPGR